MELTAVESSHVAAVGYLAAQSVLLVLYRDGALYAKPGWSAGHYAGLLAAPSKGKFLRQTIGPSILISRKEDAKTQESESRAKAGAEEQTAPGPLIVLDEDAGKCCQRASAGWLGNKAECPKCGLSFRAETVGNLRHWRIMPAVVIVR